MASWERTYVSSYTQNDITKLVTDLWGNIYWTTVHDADELFAIKRWDVDTQEETEIGDFGYSLPGSGAFGPALAMFDDELYLMFAGVLTAGDTNNLWRILKYNPLIPGWVLQYTRTYTENLPSDQDQLQLFCADDNRLIYIIYDPTNGEMKEGHSADGKNFTESFTVSPALDTTPIYLVENHNSAVVGPGKYPQRWPTRAYMYAHGGADSGAYRFSGGGWIRHGGDWGDWDGSGQNLGPVNGDRVWRYHKGEGNWEYSGGPESFASWSDLGTSQQPAQSLNWDGTMGFSSNNAYLWDDNDQEFGDAEALSGGTLSELQLVIRMKNGDSFLVGYNGSNQLEIYQRSESLPAPSTLYAELWQDQNGVGAERKSELPFEGVATGAMAVKKNLDVIVGSNVSGETMVVKGVADDDYHDLSDITDNIETSTGIERIEVIDG